MADEITISTRLQLDHGSAQVDEGDSDLSFTQTGTKKHQTIQTIATSATALSIGDMTTPGFCYLKNLDATNFVKIRMGSTGADVIKIKAGEVAGPFRFASTNPYAIADTASCKLKITVLED